MREVLTGASCTGDNGELNRTLALTNLATNEQVYLDGFLLNPDTQYTIANTTVSTITFLVNVFNAQNIVVIYSISSATADSTSIPVGYYTTITEARNFTGASISEYSNNAMLELIKRATYEIDMKTARTWQSPITEIDALYDGDDTDTLWLRHTDIQSVTSMSIRQSYGDYTVSYTTITPSYVAVYPEGYLILYTNAEINRFTSGPKNVKITFTYGASKTTQLNGAIDDDDVTITVDSTSGFKPYGCVIIDGEWITYTGLTSTTFTGCTRGMYGTEAISHLDNANIYQAPPEEVRQACNLLVANYIDKDNNRQIWIDAILSKLAWKGPRMA